MTDAAAAATTTASGTENAPSTAQAQAQPNAETVLGQQQPAGQEGQQQAQKPAEQQAQAPAVPESYAFSNLPEGYVLDDTALGEWSGVFKDLGLTQEQADKLVQMDAKRVLAGTEAAQQQAAQARQQQFGEWVNELKADPEFGGAKFDANVGIAQKALAAYGSPELTKALDESGMGSHPEVVKFFHKVGKELQEGSLHRATTTVPAQTWAQRMYPGMNP